MQDKKSTIQEKRDKSRRIHKMKMFIIFFIFGGITISLLANIFLAIEMFKLNKRLDGVEKRGSEPTAHTEASPTASVGTLVQSDSGTGEGNLAKPEDTLKVYLTFDDGPSANTDKILDILDDYGVKATFFVTGHSDAESSARYKRIVDEGHTIGMHSYSHKYKEVYASLSSFQEDYDKIHDLIKTSTGVDCNLYRFPGGSSNQVSGEDMSYFIDFLNKKNVKYYDWNVTSGDASSTAYTSQELIENVMSDVVKYKTSIVLMHDAENKKSTVEALPTLIETLQAKGAVILPISDDTALIQHVTLQNK
ncbi:MAG: polysaccharide deacetylase [Lachnospiraceae bacterium]|jgi:peptidoglycan/xylan/chitin deacetylase (PgdA/CDA1 family)|nr:polysaccharide deacetylase [Lachnospiraceae bacterium]